MLAHQEEWQLFMRSGMLWAVNRLISLLGWRLVVVTDDDGSVLSAHPERTEVVVFPNEAAHAEAFERACAAGDIGPIQPLKSNVKMEVPSLV